MNACSLITLLTRFVLLIGLSAAAPGRGTPLDSPLLDLEHVRVPFVENVGQFDPQVAFRAHTFAGDVFVTHDGRIVLAAGAPFSDHAAGTRVAIYETPVSDRPGAPGTPQPYGEASFPAAIKFMTDANRPQSATEANGYQWVNMGESVAGVELRLRASGTNVERYFHVRPGADPEQILMALEGHVRLEVEPTGELRIDTVAGSLRYSDPVAWQDIDGQRHEVSVAYRTRGPGYGFEVGAYDADYELVIDPLIAATHLGGSTDDFLVDAAYFGGSVYVAGASTSMDFPTTPGAYDTDPVGASSGLAVISRLSPDLSSLLASTYFGQVVLGGFSDRVGHVDLEVHGGDVYVAYRTSSTENPVSVSSFDGTINGGVDTFIARLSGDLSTLLGSTFLGGSATDEPYDLEINSANDNVCVGGITGSSNFPVSAGAHNTSHNGTFDGYITCLDDALTTLVSSTFLGTSNFDSVHAIYPFSGGVFAAGVTFGASAFPTPLGVFQTPFGASDGFVALFANSAQLVSATLFGSSGADQVVEVVLHNGSVYIAGSTGSGSGFPIVGGADTTFAGGSDAFIARFDGFLSALQASTFHGGALDEHASGLALDSAGDVYLIGRTTSFDLPTSSDAFQSGIVGSDGLFLARFNPLLANRSHSTYLSAAIDVSVPMEISVPVPGEVYLAANSRFSFVTEGSYQDGTAMAEDGWVARYRMDGSSTQLSWLMPGPVSEGDGVANVSATRSGSTEGLSVVSVDLIAGTALPGDDYQAPASSLLIWQPGVSSPQVASVPLVNDQIAENVESFEVELYGSFGATLVAGQELQAVTVDDDDIAGVMVSPTTGPELILMEAQDQTQILVSLTSQPVSSLVGVRASSDNTTAGTLPDGDASGVVALTFDDANWNIPQPIVVESVDDDIDDGTQPFQLDFQPVTSMDPFYAGMTIPSIDFQTLDDDTAGILFSSPTMPLVTSEAGTIDTFMVQLTSEPLTSVSISVVPDGEGQDEGMLTPQDLSFTPGNWDAQQQVLVTGLDDLIVDGDVQYEVLYSGASLDALYDFGVTGGGPLVINQDDDALAVDVTVMVDDNQTQMLPFVPTTYRVDILNRTPVVLNDVEVITTANRIDESSISWTCQSVDMSTCDQASGTGHLSTTVDLDSSGAVFFEVMAAAINQPFEQAVFTAEALVPFGTSDSNPSDNLDLDSNLIFVSIVFNDSFEDQP